jgi:hypothetical protein
MALAVVRDEDLSEETAGLGALSCRRRSAGQTAERSFALRIETNGAPEEIRTPDPQIRRQVLGQRVQSPF